MRDCAKRFVNVPSDLTIARPQQYPTLVVGHAGTEVFRGRFDRPGTPGDPHTHPERPQRQRRLVPGRPASTPYSSPLGSLERSAGEAGRPTVRPTPACCGCLRPLCAPWPQVRTIFLERRRPGWLCATSCASGPLEQVLQATRRRVSCCLPQRVRDPAFCQEFAHARSSESSPHVPYAPSADGVATDAPPLALRPFGGDGGCRASTRTAADSDATRLPATVRAVSTEPPLVVSGDPLRPGRRRT